MCWNWLLAWLVTVSSLSFFMLGFLVKLFIICLKKERKKENTSTGKTTRCIQLNLTAWVINSPFSSSKKPHFQNEVKWETFLVKMSFTCMRITNHFHINGFAITLALKQTIAFEAIRKWPIYWFKWSYVCYLCRLLRSAWVAGHWIEDH